MQFSKIFIPTAKEVPKDAIVQSHILMIRAGIVKKLSSGIYSILPLGYRVIKKVENIIREEMDRIGGNEFFLPVLIPGELWKQSNRWFSMGSELYRLKDRNVQDFVLAPTHEEVFTFLLKDHIKSYRDLPLTVYHIGIKFRDEIRPRFGVMRGKTFIMKDAYSFHRADRADSLDKTYNDMAGAYRRIFKRCGLKTIPVAADSGSMGGSQSEEFMVPASVGEEEIVRCRKCHYIANREKAACRNKEIVYNDRGELSIVETPNVRTISDLAQFLGKAPENFIKTLIYRIPASRGPVNNSSGSEGILSSSGRYVMVLIRGDLDVNETKLKNYLGAAEIEMPDTGDVMRDLSIPLGFAGPIGVKDVLIVSDFSTKGMRGGVTGANEENYHFINVTPDRDFKVDSYSDFRLVKEGDGCPKCDGVLELFKGIELGHIFKLGDKYTKAFEMYYVDEDGSLKVPHMGCYGIGVERTVAAVIEQNHDENGIIWPISVAPFHVYILPVKYAGRMKDVSNRLYEELSGAEIEALLDDREVRPGVKFKDADLIGIPFRITVGDRGLDEGVVELTVRRSGIKESVTLESIVSVVRDRVSTELKMYS